MGLLPGGFLSVRGSVGPVTYIHLGYIFSSGNHATDSEFLFFFLFIKLELIGQTGLSFYADIGFFIYSSVRPSVGPVTVNRSESR